MNQSQKPPAAVKPSPPQNSKPPLEINSTTENTNGILKHEADLIDFKGETAYTRPINLPGSLSTSDKYSGGQEVVMDQKIISSSMETLEDNNSYAYKTTSRRISVGRRNENKILADERDIKKEQNMQSTNGGFQQAEINGGENTFQMEEKKVRRQFSVQTCNPTITEEEKVTSLNRTASFQAGNGTLMQVMYQ